MAYKNKIGSRRHTGLPLPNLWYWNHNTTSWTLPEPCWILQKQSISGFSSPFNLKKQIWTDWKWLSLWHTLTTSYQAGKRPRSKKGPGKYLNFSGSLKSGLKVSLQRHRSESELTTTITVLVQGRNCSQDTAPSHITWSFGHCSPLPHTLAIKYFWDLRKWFTDRNHYSLHLLWW